MTKFFVVAVLLCAVSITNAFAVTRCERSSSGGMCCWDTTVNGPFKPIGC
jgi:hypothetical protein